MTDSPSETIGGRRRRIRLIVAATVACVLIIGVTVAIISSRRDENDAIEVFRTTLEADGFRCERRIFFGDKMFSDVTGGMVCEREKDALRMLTFGSESAKDAVAAGGSPFCEVRDAPGNGATPELGLPEGSRCCPNMAVLGRAYLVNAGYISEPQNSPPPGLDEVADALGQPIRDVCDDN